MQRSGAWKQMGCATTVLFVPICFNIYEWSFIYVVSLQVGGVLRAACKVETKPVSTVSLTMLKLSRFLAHRLNKYILGSSARKSSCTMGGEQNLSI
jgi:hypothetical protein